MVFVTGGTGYTGPHVVSALCKAGLSVRCLTRPTSRVSRLDSGDVEIVTGDLDDSGSLAEHMRGTDTLVSVAHLRFAPKLILACQEAGVRRCVFFSSTWRFSKVRTSEVKVVSDGEKAIEDAGLDATLIRPTMIYGPGDDRNISRLRTHVTRRPVFPIFGSGEQLVQPVHVCDVADAAVGALLRVGTVGKAYEIAGPEPMTYRAMVDVLCAIEGKRVLKVYIPLFAGIPLVALYERLVSNPAVRVEQVRRMGEDRAFDISAAVRELGFAPRTFEEGIRDTASFDGKRAS